MRPRASRPRAMPRRDARAALRRAPRCVIATIPASASALPARSKPISRGDLIMRQRRITSAPSRKVAMRKRGLQRGHVYRREEIELDAEFAPPRGRASASRLGEQREGVTRWSKVSGRRKPGARPADFVRPRDPLPSLRSSRATPGEIRRLHPDRMDAHVRRCRIGSGMPARTGRSRSQLARA